VIVALLRDNALFRNLIAILEIDFKSFGKRREAKDIILVAAIIANDKTSPRIHVIVSALLIKIKAEKDDGMPIKSDARFTQDRARIMFS